MTLNEILHKIEDSFKAAIHGTESLRTLIRWWGFISYATFFIVDKLILAINSRLFDVAMSSVGLVYFVWHIFVMFRCKPKAPKLSKEEKQKLRAEKIHNMPKSFMRKLLLQESISKWNPFSMTIAVDLLFFTNFLGYILH